MGPFNAVKKLRKKSSNMLEEKPWTKFKMKVIPNKKEPFEDDKWYLS